MFVGLGFFISLMACLDIANTPICLLVIILGIDAAPKPAMAAPDLRMPKSSVHKVPVKPLNAKNKALLRYSDGVSSVRLQVAIKHQRSFWFRKTDFGETFRRNKMILEKMIKTSGVSKISPN